MQTARASNRYSILCRVGILYHDKNWPNLLTSFSFASFKIVFSAFRSPII